MRPNTAADKQPGESALQVWRTNTLNVVLIVVAIVASLALGNVVISAISEPAQWPAMGIFVLFYLLVVVMAIFRRINQYARAWGFLLVGYTAGALAFARGGLAGNGRVYIMALPLIAFILIGVRTGAATTFLSMLMFAAFSIFADRGLMQNWLIPSFQTNPLTIGDWVQGGLNVAMMLAPVAILLWRFIRFHEKTLTTEQQATTEWARASTLANERAAELENANALLAERTEALSAATAITRQVASLTDEQSLLEQFVRLVAEHMKLDNVNLFLLDAQQEYAVLRTTAFEAKMQADQQDRRVLASSEDPVGKATRGIETLISPASLDTAPHSVNPWRVVLPLQIRKETLGALDIHFKAGQIPSQERIQALKTLADQLAISLKNTRLLQEIQQGLEAERKARGEWSRQAWQETLRTYGQVGFLRNKSGIQPAADVRRQDMEIALQTGKPTLNENDPAILTIPILARNQVIGAVEAHRPKDAGGWTSESTPLIETLVEQLGVALDSARLYEDTQRRAAREKMIGEVTARMRESLDMEAVLQTAAKEMRQALGLAEVQVQLGINPDHKTKGDSQ